MRMRTGPYLLRPALHTGHLESAQSLHLELSAHPHRPHLTVVTHHRLEEALEAGADTVVVLMG